jgi:drug/metabolite transporter (DMT)-like permease
MLLDRGNRNNSFSQAMDHGTATIDSANRQRRRQFRRARVPLGIEFPTYQVSLEGLSPGQVMILRLAFGGVFLATVMRVTGRRWPREPRVLMSLAAVSMFSCVVPFQLYAWAGQYLPSSLSSIYNATAPLATLLVSLILIPDERLTGKRIGGLVAGAMGVVILAAPWGTQALKSEDPVVLAQLACLAANLCYGVAFTLSRMLLRSSGYDATTIAGGQIGIAAIFGLVLAPFIGGFEPVNLTLPVVASIVALGSLGTGLAYIWHFNIIAAWGAPSAATVTYAIPIIGVGLGILVFGESLQWNEPVGGVLILFGPLVSQGWIGGAGRRSPINPSSPEKQP